MSLLTKSPDQVAATIAKMKKEAKSIIVDSLKTTWYMRGGVSYTEALMLSHEERQEINEIIKENLDTVKKTGLPFF